MIRVGDIRPSQIMFSFGVGSVLDLPQFSALVMGLDSWQPDLCALIDEPRLLAALQRRLGPQLTTLRMPPVQEDSMETEGMSDNLGIPVVPFPRWLRCTLCGAIAPVDSGIFKLSANKYRPDRTGYVHESCSVNRFQTAPRAVPVRFLLACNKGHLSDIPWVDYVHDGSPCPSPRLFMREFGVTGDAAGIHVKCESCGKGKRLGLLFTQRNPFPCPGLHPHLRWKDPSGCDADVKVVNLGASNLWFAQSMSVLSIPDAQSLLETYVRQHWNTLIDADDIAVINFLSKKQLPELAEYPAHEVLKTIIDRKNALSNPAPETAYDIKLPEWNVFTGISRIRPEDKQELEVSFVPAPQGYGRLFEQTTLVHRLREVRALYGFCRVDLQQELDLGQESSIECAPLTRGQPTWLPACETRGEGIFVRLKEEAIQSWEQLPLVRTHDALFKEAHRAWRSARRFQDTLAGYPGVRFVLLHSLSHALMRQIALECGYTAASVRERLYCRDVSHPEGPMAGVLLYTAASDSEGTLGGLVSLGDPVTLGRHLKQALESMRLCASDPLCSERVPTNDGRSIHGASCHACLFSPETSCESGNRYLDRNVLIETFAEKSIEFFVRGEDEA